MIPTMCVPRSCGMTEYAACLQAPPPALQVCSPLPLLQLTSQSGLQPMSTNVPTLSSLMLIGWTGSRPKKSHRVNASQFDSTHKPYTLCPLGTKTHLCLHFRPLTTTLWCSTSLPQSSPPSSTLGSDRACAESGIPSSRPGTIPQSSTHHIYCTLQHVCYTSTRQQHHNKHLHTEIHPHRPSVCFSH